MLEPVIPLDHCTVPLQPVAVKVVVPDGQVVGPATTVGGATVVGAGGQGATVTTVGLLVQPLAVQVAA